MASLPDYDSLTMKQLRDMCRSKGIRGYSRLRRDELVAHIKKELQKRLRRKQQEESQKKSDQDMYDRGMVPIGYPSSRWKHPNNNRRYIYVVTHHSDDYYHYVDDTVVFNNLADAKRYLIEAEKKGGDDDQVIELNIVRYVHSDVTTNITVPKNWKKTEGWV